MCTRGTRTKKVLVRRAQLRIDQPTLFGSARELGRSIVKCSDRVRPVSLPCSLNARPEKALVGRAQ